jgi:hypothetical protein
MKPPAQSSRLLRAACVLALVGLASMTWSLFDPRPIPVIVAMSIGQAIGTLSFLVFGVVVVRDLRRRQREARNEGDEGNEER